MDVDRRRFLAGGLAAGLGGWLPGGRAEAGDVEEEVRRRARYLSTPDGIPYDPKFGVPFRSPCAAAFKDPLFIPAIARPEIDMTDGEWIQLSNQDWLKRFGEEFAKIVEKFRSKGIRLGQLPVPEAHQRFWEFRPQKFYVLREREVPRSYHSDYGLKPNCWTWCFESLCEDGSYQASSPGPTIRARYWEPILLRRINDLPEAGNHEAAARVKFALPSTTTHLHNAHTASESDGNPDDFINPGEYWDHHYANFPSGFDDREKLTTLWYHDHRMDYTAANVYAGLDGFYFLFDEKAPPQRISAKCDPAPRPAGEPKPGNDPKPEFEQQDVGDPGETLGWRLPEGPNSKYDIPLILHDLLFRPEGEGSPQLVFDGYNSDGVLGDQFTVNRIIRPHLEVEPRKYRFRILNGGPSRFYEISLHTRKDGGRRQDIPCADPFVVITGDGNFQASPIAADSIHLGVAQRVDVILDFSRYQPGDQIYLVNRLRQIKGQGATGELIPVTEGGANEEIDAFYNDNSLLRFDVVPKRSEDRSELRLMYRPLPEVDLSEVARYRTWRFDHDGGLWTVNGRVFDGNRIDAGIEEGSAEIWTLRNEGSGWQHPIHSHFTEFIALEIDGQPQYQVDVQTGQVVHKGGSYQRSLIDMRHVLPELERRLKAHPPDEVIPPERRRHYGGARPEAAIAGIKDGKKILPEQEAKKFVEDIHEYFRKKRYSTVTSFLDDIKRFPKDFDLNLHVERFIGGPRRDVALLFPGTELKVFMRWRDFRGKYVMHCHNVVHEDHAMMVRWDITPRGEGFDTPHRARPNPERPTDRPYSEPHPGQTAAQPQTITIEPQRHQEDLPR